MSRQFFKHGWTHDSYRGSRVERKGFCVPLTLAAPAPVAVAPDHASCGKAARVNVLKNLKMVNGKVVRITDQERRERQWKNRMGAVNNIVRRRRNVLASYYRY